jgi:hypothetical protein
MGGREVRRTRGLEAELSLRAHVTACYIWRLESGGAAPGIDLVARLSRALGTTSHGLMPATALTGTMGVLHEQACGLLETLLTAADRDTMLMLNPLWPGSSRRPNEAAEGAQREVCASSRLCGPLTLHRLSPFPRSPDTARLRCLLVFGKWWCGRAKVAMHCETRTLS